MGRVKGIVGRLTGSALSNVVSSPLFWARHRLFWLLRQKAGAVALFAVVSGAVIGLASSNFDTQQELWNRMENRTDKETGGFLLGAYIPEADAAYAPTIDLAGAMAEFDRLETAIEEPLSIISIYQPWGPESLEKFPQAQLDAIRARGSIPMITWEPMIHTFPKAQTDQSYLNNWKVFEKIVNGEFDDYLEAYAIRIRDYGGPVLIRFAHEPDNPSFAWSPEGYNTPEEYVAGWRYIVSFFNGMGASNAAWVWSPWKPEAIDIYHPGDQYLDWAGLTILNYGKQASDGSWDSFSALYQPFHEKLAGRPAPILISEFGSTTFGGSRAEWIAEALHEIADQPKIGGVVFFDSQSDLNWPLDWSVEDRGQPITWRIDRVKDAELITESLAGLSAARKFRRLKPHAEQSRFVDHSQAVSGESGNWQLIVDGAPFFIRGVAYAAGDGWRSVDTPTRSVVESDFASIAAMGANTVRRYASGWADENVLKAAANNGLKVIMGFWLPHDLDYSNNNQVLMNIKDDIIDAVARRRHDPTILSWSIGNETWGHLKHYYADPHLTEVRTAYLGYLEEIARAIKELDPSRPVFTSIEYSDELPAALFSTRRMAPSIDAIGINAYYDSHFEKLDSQVAYFTDGMPYYISEFGPDGYWDHDDTSWGVGGIALEPTDPEKAAQYAERWRRYVIGNAPRNIGGVAFAWKDRFEGSITWFGLTDFEGRRKPAYHALEGLWRKAPKTAELLPALSDTRVKIENMEPASKGRFLVRLDATDWPDECSIEWRIVSEGTFEIEREDTTACQVREISIALPNKTGRFRLHASVVANNDVVTASAPILLD